MTQPVVISAAVEGLLDAAVVHKLLSHVGAKPGAIHNKGGKHAVREKIDGYNRAARLAPWIVLVDLDQEYPCASALRDEWLPNREKLLCFRVAVRELESWLLADREAFARFLGVPLSRIPMIPEGVADPKQTIVQLVEHYSVKLAIKTSLVPRHGSGRETGAGYDGALIEFVHDRWNPLRASSRSRSLARAIDCFRRAMTLATSTTSSRG